MDWGQFEFDYRLRLPDPKLLITIEAYREAALNLVLPPEWRDRLDRLNRVRAVHGTTALEGNPLSEEQVAESLDDRDTERQWTREQAQISGFIRFSSPEGDEQSIIELSLSAIARY